MTITSQDVAVFLHNRFMQDTTEQYELLECGCDASPPYIKIGSRLGATRKFRIEVTEITHAADPKGKPS